VILLNYKSLLFCQFIIERSFKNGSYNLVDMLRRRIFTLPGQQTRNLS